MNEKVTQKAKEILETYFLRTLSKEVEIKIQEWYLDNKYREEKDSVLQEIFENRLKPNFQFDQSLEDSFNELVKLLKLSSEEESRNLKKVSLKRRWSFALKVAAVVIPLIVVVGSVGLWFGKSSNTQDLTLMATEVSLWVTGNEQQKILLADSSEVWVSPGSNILYMKEFEKDRKVRLTGEAFFNVKKGGDVPFVVETQHLKIAVTGTEFRVVSLLDADHTTVDLYRGEVDVEAGNEHTLMKPGQRFEFDRTTAERVVKPLPANEKSPFGILSVENGTLGAVLRLIEQKYNVTFETQGNIDLQGNYTLFFNEDEKIVDVLNILRDVTGKYKNYQINDNKIVLENN